MEDGKQLVAMAEERSLTLMVGHILQYHDAIAKLKNLIDAGELGKIQYISSHRLSIGKIRTEENTLWSFAPHDISVILMLLGEEPNRVYATGGAFLQNDVADVTLTTMNFPSGVKAHIFVSWLHPFKEQKLVVIGDKKMAVFNDVSKDKLKLYPHQIQWVNRAPIANKADPEIVALNGGEPLRNECLHFLDCIEHGHQPRTDGREGLRVLNVLQQSQRVLDKYLNGSPQPAPTRDVTPYRAELPSNVFVHESAYIDHHVVIGNGTKIWHYSHILPNTIIGASCNIGQNVMIGPDVCIGSGCKIQNNVSVYKGVVLEADVFCGPSMVFTNIHNPRAHVPRMAEVRETIVGRGASLGANCTIVCGNRIGRFAFIGAGAVVVRDVPEFAMMAGNPARLIGWICMCGEKLTFIGQVATCQACGEQYQQISDQRVVQISETENQRKTNHRDRREYEEKKTDIY
jgi:UDP-2-acetamido-3-amino-2,3-dideoxy-glucuronate N-acetyltransferase